MSFNKYPVYLTRYSKDRPTHGTVSQGIVDEGIGKTFPGAVLWDVSSFKAIVDGVHRLFSPIFDQLKADPNFNNNIKTSHGMPKAEVFDRVFVSVETDASGKFIAPAYIFINCEKTSVAATNIEMITANKGSFDPLNTKYTDIFGTTIMHPFRRDNIFDMTNGRILITTDLLLEDFTPFSFGEHQRYENKNRNTDTRNALVKPPYNLEIGKSYSMVFIRPNKTRDEESGMKYSEGPNGEILDITLQGNKNDQGWDFAGETEFVSHDKTVYDLNKPTAVPLEFTARMGPNKGKIYQLQAGDREMNSPLDGFPSRIIANNGIVDRKFFTNDIVRASISAERARRFITFPVLLGRSPLHSYCFQPFPRAFGYMCIPNRLRNDVTEECTARATMGNDSYGDDCNDYYNSLSNPEKSVVIHDICNKDRGLNECDCYSRDNNPAYQFAIQNEAATRQNDFCWYRACSTTDRSMWIDPDLTIGKICSICMNITNLDKLNNVTIGEIEQSINCLSKSKDAAVDGVGINLGKISDAIVNAGTSGNIEELGVVESLRKLIEEDKRFIAVLALCVCIFLISLYVIYQVAGAWITKKKYDAYYAQYPQYQY